MKLYKNARESRAPSKRNIVGGLASAAVMLTIAACGDGGGLSLESIEADLAEGEEIDIVISTNEDGDLVIGAPDSGDALDDGAGIAAGAGAIYALTNQHNPAIQISASADAPDEPDRVNQVVAYARADDGSLEEIGIYDTGGIGENIRASGANPLASQDPLIVSKDQRFVFAVNAGSESISSFVINDDFTLTPASLDVSTQGSSGAQNPVSLTIFEDILYVVNTGNFVDADGVELTVLPQDRNRVNSSIIAFQIGDDGSLTELPGSELTGIGANAGSIEFSSDGLFLSVTERRTNNIVMVTLDDNFLPLTYDSGEVRTTLIPSITAVSYTHLTLPTTPYV